MDAENSCSKSLAFSAGKNRSVLSSLTLPRLIFTSLLMISLTSQEVTATEYYENYSRFKQSLKQSIQQSKTTKQLPVSEGIMLKYNDTLISFETHNGQIKSQNICYSVRHCDEAKYAKCMTAVNDFFRETCYSLQQADSALPLVSTYRQQYCGAVEALKNKELGYSKKL